MIVIDADRHGQHDGVENFGDLMAAHGYQPDNVPLAATPNEGTHFFYRQPAGQQLGNREGSLPEGVNVRGHGGYVIAPGTVMQDGRMYEVFGEIEKAPELPDWLARILQTDRDRRERGGAVGDAGSADLVPVKPLERTPHDDARIEAYCAEAIRAEVSRVETAPEGARNNTLNEAAFSLGQLVGAGWVRRSEIEGLLLSAASVCGLRAFESRATVRSGLNAGEKEPRTMPGGEINGYDHAEAAEASRRLREQHDGSVVDTETGEIVSDIVSGYIEREYPGTAVEHFDLPDELLRPGGLVEEIADWICQGTDRPVRVHAIGAALTVLGTLMGRKVYSQTRPAGTHLYAFAMAPSGVGKQHSLDCIKLILKAINPNLVNGWHSSGPKFAAILSEQPTRLLVVDEFSEKMKALRGRNTAVSMSAVSEVLRELWGCSISSSYRAPGALSRGDFEIERPCLSIFGASTLQRFRDNLNVEDVENGLFNRFMILPRFEAVERGAEPEGALEVPHGLIQACRAVYECLAPVCVSNANSADSFPLEPVMVPFSDEARAMNEANKDYEEDLKAMADEDLTMSLYGRYAEQIKRVAMLVACGKHPGGVASAVIRKDDMEFAERLVKWSTEQFALMVRRDMIESAHQAQFNLIAGIIRKAKKIDRSALYRGIRGRVKKRDIEDIIGMLTEGGNIETLSVGTTKKGGRPKIIYAWKRS